MEQAIAPLWDEVYGDRQQEIVFIGQSLDKKAVCKAFDECLVSDESMTTGQDTWNEMVNEVGDPFQETWDAAIALAQEESKHDGHDHDHSHGHHH